MKNQKHFLKICLVVFTFLLTSSAFAQNQVRITLHQPPPNQLSAKDLWKMTLENTTGSPLEIYLEGYGDEEKQGRIVDGRSQVFTLPVGKSNYNYESFKSGNVSWKNRDYEEFIIRTGTVPAGTYNTCVTAYSSEGNIVGMEKCMTQLISREYEGEITLISPSDGEKLDFNKPINFSWTPLQKVDHYELKIVKVENNITFNSESFENAKSIYQNNMIKTPFYTIYPERTLELNSSYIWGIRWRDRSDHLRRDRFSNWGFLHPFTLINRDTSYVWDTSSVWTPNPNSEQYCQSAFTYIDFVEMGVDEFKLRTKVTSFQNRLEYLEFKFNGHNIQNVIESFTPLLPGGNNYWIQSGYDSGELWLSGLPYDMSTDFLDLAIIKFHEIKPFKVIIQYRINVHRFHCTTGWINLPVVQ